MRGHRARKNREVHFKEIFKNSSPTVRRLYWLVTLTIDFLGFLILYLFLCVLYAHASLYLQNFLLRQVSLFLFFVVLGTSGFFFHTKVTLALLSFFYRWYSAEKGIQR